MRKVLTIFAFLIIILCVLAQAVLPSIAARTVASRLSTVLDTQEITAEVSSYPALLLAVGHISTLDITAEHGRLGKVRTESLRLTGTEVSLDPAVVAGGRFALRDAASLQLEGIISEANLEEYLSKNVKNLKNVSVTLTHDGVQASGQVKIFGREADVILEGSFQPADEGIYLHTRHVQIRNSRLGRNLDMNMFSDFLIVDLTKINLPLTVEDIMPENGRVVVRTAYKR